MKKNPAKKDPDVAEGSWMPATALPQQLAHLLDSERPIPKPWHYIPAAGGSLWALAYTGFWLLSWSGLGLTAVIELVATLTGAPIGSAGRLPALVAGGFILACGTGSYFSYRSLRRTLHTRRLKQAGIFRQGLFISNERLLLYHETRALMTTKEAILRFYYRYRKGDPSVVEVHLRDAEGNVVAVDLGFLDMNYGNGGARAMIGELQRWLERPHLA